MISTMTFRFRVSAGTLVLGVMLASPRTGIAQTTAPAQGPQTTQSVSGSQPGTAAATPPVGATAPSASSAAPSAPTAYRASWLADRRPLRVGDILTIVVDEQTSASERVSTTATGNRSQSAKLNAGIGAVKLGPEKGFGTGMEASSRDDGAASRTGDLTAVLSVRVTELDPAGNARIEGQKTVTVDGRSQVVSLKGLVRPEDVTSSNLVQSSRIADATVDYKGKKIGPRQGILGKILSILWP